MPFNSVTGRAALCRQGGLAAAEYHRLRGFEQLKRMRRLSAIVRTRQRLEKQIIALDADWRRIYGEPLLVELLRRQDASQRLDS